MIHKKWLSTKEHEQKGEKKPKTSLDVNLLCSSLGPHKPSCTTSIFFNRAIRYLQTNAIIKYHYHHCQCLVNNIQRSFTQCCGELGKDELHSNIGGPALTGHLSITNTGVIIYRMVSYHSAHYWSVISIGKKPMRGGRRQGRRGATAQSS